VLTVSTHACALCATSADAGEAAGSAGAGAEAEPAVQAVAITASRQAGTAAPRGNASLKSRCRRQVTRSRMCARAAAYRSRMAGTASASYLSTCPIVHDGGRGPPDSTQAA
jgi:hypothetical protein